MGGIDYIRHRKSDEQASSVARVSLSKVTLTASAPTVVLTKRGVVGGLIRVNLNWNARPSSPSSVISYRKVTSAPSPAIDLDLACLYEFTDGSKGVVQALGKSFQAYSAFTNDPVIWLDGDDRSGSNSDGENLFVNLAYSAQIRRILIFAFIYDGTPSWAETDGVVTLFSVDGPLVDVRLGEHDSRATTCAIAMLENVHGALQVRREVRYVEGGHVALDRAYDWGITWGARVYK